jgi:DNA end-binding protein Ku
MREAQHLAALEVIGDALVLTSMRFGDELVDPGTLSFPTDRHIRKQDLEMAKSLVNTLAADWEPEKYTDQYRENLMRIIKGKLKGKDVELEPTAERPRADVVDLMERLRQSLEQGRAKKRGTSARAGRTKRSAAGTKKRTRRAA